MGDETREIVLLDIATQELKRAMRNPEIASRGTVPPPKKERHPKAPNPPRRSFWERLASIFTMIVIGMTSIVAMVLIALRACQTVVVKPPEVAAIERIDTLAEGRPEWVRRIAQVMREGIRKGR